MTAETKTKLLLRDAQWLAYEIVSWLQPGARQIAVAGSIRRHKPLVGDIEIVAEPVLTVSRNLFGEETGHTSALDLIVEHHIAAGHWEYDPQVKRNSPKYKRLFVPSMNVAVDLFFVAARNWGNQLVIRTGSSDFGRLMLTARALGGLMPPGLSHHDGYLYRRALDEHGAPAGAEEQLACLTEEQFFARLIGPGFMPHPTWRDAETAALMRRLTTEQLRATGRDAPRER